MKKLTVILIILVAVFFTSTLVLLYPNLNKHTPDQIEVNPVEIISPSIIPTTDPTIDWMTFTNIVYDYTFKYPKNWTLRGYAGEQLSPEERTSFVIEGSINNSTDISDLNIRVNLSFTNPINCRGDCPVIETSTDITLYNITSKKNTGYIGGIGGETPRQYVSYIVPIKDKFLEFILESSKQQANQNEIIPLTSQEITLFDQILSTFKFFDSKDSVEEAVRKKINSTEVIEITKTRIEGDFAIGDFNVPTIENYGGRWIAKLINGSWLVIEDGPTTPSCNQVTKYNFPKSLVPECIDLENQNSVWISR